MSMSIAGSAPRCAGSARPTAARRARPFRNRKWRERMRENSGQGDAENNLRDPTLKEHGAEGAHRQPTREHRAEAERGGNPRAGGPQGRGSRRERPWRCGWSSRRAVEVNKKTETKRATATQEYETTETEKI